MGYDESVALTADGKALFVANSATNALGAVKVPVVVNGTDKGVPAQTVLLVRALVVTVGTRTVTIAVAGLPGRPSPQPFATATT